jgi:predicted nucleotidyltransferase component of viral defense system
VIPAANITAWRQEAPWPDDNQVEQDLILSRLIVAIAADDLLGPELAFRGGTCLHKLHLGSPLRYSEDLDYVRRTNSGIGPYLDALRRVATDIGLDEHGRDLHGPMVQARFDAVPTSGTGLIRVKVEINVGETEAFLPRQKIPYSVASPWWHGEAEIDTFALEELLATKLRALFQRNKGRDLFDLWHVLTHLDPDPGVIVETFGHYMGEREFTFPELARNLEAKLEDRDFRDDVLQLVTDRPDGYDPIAAADALMERLGPHMRNAPTLDEIQAGAWRR